MANESRSDLIEGRRRQSLATGVSSIPLTWLAMFRRADLVISRSVRFSISWESAVARLRDPRGLSLMFASYGDLSQHTSMLADTLATHVSARGPAPSSTRASIDVSEIAGEHPDPREWARALGTALDALDDPAPTPAPITPPTTVDSGLTAIDKIRRLRHSADLGINEARERLREHAGDLQAALAAADASKSHEQRARDQAGEFVARLAHPPSLAPRPPWQVLLEASGLEHGRPFPPPAILLQGSSATDDDLRTHARLLGESVAAGRSAGSRTFAGPEGLDACRSQKNARCIDGLLKLPFSPETSRGLSST